MKCYNCKDMRGFNTHFDGVRTQYELKCNLIEAELKGIIPPTDSKNYCPAKANAIKVIGMQTKELLDELTEIKDIRDRLERDNNRLKCERNAAVGTQVEVENLKKEIEVKDKKLENLQAYTSDLQGDILSMEIRISELKEENKYYQKKVCELNRQLELEELWQTFKNKYGGYKFYSNHDYPKEPWRHHYKTEL